MALVNFDPRGKSFEFRLDQYTCYRCSTGECSLENMSIKELQNSSDCVRAIGESSIEYCRGMAKLFLDGEFTAPARIYLNRKCGHYSVSDGQHRTCVVARILKKGAAVTLNAEIIEQDCICRGCLIRKDFSERESQMTWFDRRFNTRKYRDLWQDIKNYEEHEFIYTFDFDF